MRDRILAATRPAARRGFVLLLISLLALGACDSSDPAEPGDPEDALSGIEVRSDDGIFYGVLGDPRPPEGPAGGLARLRTTFPNPGHPSVKVDYVLQQDATVELWIERVPPSVAFHQLVAQHVPALPQGEPGMVRRLRGPEAAPAGFYLDGWNGLDDNGAPAGRGYYRVFLLAEGERHSADLLVVGSQDEWAVLAMAASAP